MERFNRKEQEKATTEKPWWDEQSDEDDVSISHAAPLVLVDHGPKGTRISASSPEAMALGLWPDIKLADARSMVSVLRVEQHHKAADVAAQAALCKWLTRYSPSVSAYGDDGFVLDIQGCAHLFSGEQAMASDLMDRLAVFGFSARVAIAETLAGAWALAFHGIDQINIMPAQCNAASYDALPVEALRLDTDTLLLLKRLGLKRVADVRRIPRTALERRFRERGNKAKSSYHAATSVQMRLDQLADALAEPMAWLMQPQPFRAVLQCPDLALDMQAVEIALDRLLADLCKSLSGAKRSARSFVLTAYRAEGGQSVVDVRLSQALHDPPTIRRLFQDRLDRIDCGFGIDLLALVAGGVERIDHHQNDMIEGPDRAQVSMSLTAFADTVCNRVGKPAVVQFTPHTSHVPERMQRAVPVAMKSKWRAFANTKPAQAPRPLRLLERPEAAQVTADLPDGPPAQFVWRHVLRKVIRATGPERILPEWWHDSLKTKPSAVQRDYYDCEDEDGRRYWLFRSIKDVPVGADESKKENLNDEPTTRVTEWFVHGLF